MVQNLHAPSEFSLRENTRFVHARSRRQCILVTGPLLFLQQPTSDRRSPYLTRLLGDMVEQCIEKEVITSSEVIRQLHVLVKEETLLPLLFFLEEYLPSPQSFQSCLKEVVTRSHIPISAWYQFFIDSPFSGYITTTYDTVIEHLYATIWQRPLMKCSLTSLQDISPSPEHPFLLHLYGNIDTTTSRDMRERLTRKSPLLTDFRGQLRQLIANSPAVFLGFETTDPDLKMLQEVFRGNGILIPSQVHTKEPTVQNHEQEKTISLLSPLQANKEGISSPNGQTQESSTGSEKTIEIFLSYVKQDKSTKQRLITYLQVLQRQYKANYAIDITLTDRDNIRAGHEWKREIEQYLAQAHIILLLVSIDFLNSEFCTQVEMTRALQRHQMNEARVIPIILDSCPWWNEVFRDLKVLPEEGKPVDDWRKKDKAFANICTGIEQAIKDLMKIPPKTAN